MNINYALVYFMKYGELRSQSPSVETIQAQNVNPIISGYCMSIVVVNKTGSCRFDALLDDQP